LGVAGVSQALAVQVLAGDIGGTNARLALVTTTAGGRYHVGQERSFPSSRFSSLEEIIRLYRESLGAPCDTASFGVPGPVRDRRSETTNLPWVVDARRLEQSLGVGRVALLNDLEACAWGIAALEAKDVAVLNVGKPAPRGNLALISAGTGLGQAGLVRRDEGFLPFACEGGHCDFAPQNELQVELWRHLERQFGHVSQERVISGPGLVRIFEFLCLHRRAAPPDWLRHELRAADPAAAISRAGLADRFEIASEALDLFIDAYGGEAGNLALKILATGGVYVGGGIAPRILERLGDGAFMRAFCRKGRMGTLLENVPVQVITNPQTALLGAARFASLLS
jgi:glucokinase